VPLYEYRCNTCRVTSEFLAAMNSKGDSLHCKQCGSSQLERMISVSFTEEWMEDTGAHLLRKRGTVLHPALLCRKWVHTELNSCKELNLSFSSLSEIGWC